jgi:hypothetical protein
MRDLALVKPNCDLIYMIILRTRLGKIKHWISAELEFRVEIFGLGKVTGIANENPD